MILLRFAVLKTVLELFLSFGGFFTIIFSFKLIRIVIIFEAVL